MGFPWFSMENPWVISVRVSTTQVNSAWPFLHVAKGYRRKLSLPTDPSGSEKNGSIFYFKDQLMR